MKPKHTQGSRGYTLIEVIAGIAIVAVLAAILIPVGQSAIRRGQGAKCLGNLRQMGAAFRSYIADGGTMKTPPSIYGATGWWWFADAEKSPQRGGFRSYLQNSADVILCPSAKKGPKALGSYYFPAADDEAWIYGNEARGSYCFNNALQQGSNPDIETSNYKTLVPAPSDTPLFMDGAWVDTFPTDFRYQFPPLKQTSPRTGNKERVFLSRHGSKSTHILFIDGSARAVSFDDFYNLQWYPTFNRRPDLKSPY